jgi:hypothetical protein
MSIFVIGAFVRLREHVATNAAILTRLAEIDRTLLPLLTPPPEVPKRRIGF